MCRVSLTTWSELTRICLANLILGINSCRKLSSLFKLKKRQLRKLGRVLSFPNRFLQGIKLKKFWWGPLLLWGSRYQITLTLLEDRLRKLGGVNLLWDREPSPRGTTVLQDIKNPRFIWKNQRLRLFLKSQQMQFSLSSGRKSTTNLDTLSNLVLLSLSSSRNLNFQIKNKICKRWSLMPL